MPDVWFYKSAPKAQTTLLCRVVVGFWRCCQGLDATFTLVGTSAWCCQVWQESRWKMCGPHCSFQLDRGWGSPSELPRLNLWTMWQVASIPLGSPSSTFRSVAVGCHGWNLMKMRTCRPTQSVRVLMTRRLPIGKVSSCVNYMWMEKGGSQPPTWPRRRLLLVIDHDAWYIWTWLSL